MAFSLPATKKKLLLQKITEIDLPKYLISFPEERIDKYLEAKKELKEFDIGTKYYQIEYTGGNLYYFRFCPSSKTNLFDLFFSPDMYSHETNKQVSNKTWDMTVLIYVAWLKRMKQEYESEIFNKNLMSLQKRLF